LTGAVTSAAELSLEWDKWKGANQDKAVIVPLRPADERAGMDCLATCQVGRFVAANSSGDEHSLMRPKYGCCAWPVTAGCIGLSQREVYISTEPFRYL
jgi:hypothetical protein